MRARRFIGRRNAHHAGDDEAVALLAGPEERIGPFGQNSRLLRLAAGVDLDEQSRPSALAGDLLCQRLPQAPPVDWVDGVEQRGALPWLFGLQPARRVEREARRPLGRGRPVWPPLLCAAAPRGR